MRDEEKEGRIDASTKAQAEAEAWERAFERAWKRQGAEEAALLMVMTLRGLR